MLLHDEKTTARSVTKKKAIIVRTKLIMLSKAQAKYTNSLKQKKYRQEIGAFVVEGEKAVEEFLYSKYELELIVALPQWIDSHRGIEKRFDGKVAITTEDEMAKITSFSSPSPVLAIFKIASTYEKQLQDNEFLLMLDGIRDPGNLGTIIRIADWLGIKHIICSPDCADAYNPKTVQSSMGSLSRISVYENELETVLTANKLPVYGAMLKGKNIYDYEKPMPGIILIGSESNGISKPIQRFITHPVFIPGKGKAESLNAAIACGIICSWLCK